MGGFRKQTVFWTAQGKGFKDESNDFLQKITESAETQGSKKPFLTKKSLKNAKSTIFRIFFDISHLLP